MNHERPSGRESWVRAAGGIRRSDHRVEAGASARPNGYCAPPMRIFLSAAVVLSLAVGCKKGNDTRKVALLLPESKTARYETQDRPLFEKKVAAFCKDCEVIY